MNRISALLLGVTLVLMPTAMVGCSDNVSDRDIEFVDLAEVRQLTQGNAKPGVAKLIDARTRAEFDAGHIPGAWNIELPQVSDKKDSIDPALARFKTLIVYGNDPGSGTARAMAKRLMRAGAKGVKMFAGGMAEWRGAGLKVEVTPSAIKPEPPKTEAPAAAPTGFGQPPAAK